VFSLHDSRRISGDQNGNAIGPPVLFSANTPATPFVNGLSAFFSGEADQTMTFDFEFPMHNADDVTLEFFLNIDHSDHGAIFWTRSDSDDTNRFHFFTTEFSAGQTSFGFDYVDPGDGRHTIANPLAFPVSLNTWTHIAVTRSGNTYEWFKDGVAQGSAVDTNANLPSGTGGWRLSGRDNFQFRGYLDEVRISNTVLSPSEFLNAT